jgi:3-hydroxyisobutyrate dehydrogenase-like beta-hydroxyacid dehydrogenase
MTTEMRFRRIAMVGFGEAGSILSEDLAATGREVVTYDILFDAPATRGPILEKAHRLRIQTADTLNDAVANADLVISAVTAASSAAVAHGAARVLRAGQIFLDVNSVSPATKRSNADGIQKAGADYVEAAVMAPVPPQRLKVPMLLGGRRAAELAIALKAIGMNTTAIADEIGVASAVKMCRSIVIKGLEALALESMLAARRLGAEKEVLASLQGTFPGMGWQDKLPDYLVSRIAEHGRRRAAEMREVARTLEEVGIEPTMALATATRQDGLIDAMAAQGVTYPRGEPFSWQSFVDALGAGTPTPQQNQQNITRGKS